MKLNKRVTLNGSNVQVSFGEAVCMGCEASKDVARIETAALTLMFCLVCLDQMRDTLDNGDWR